jgi:hypothetical protein
MFRKLILFISLLVLCLLAPFGASAQADLDGTLILSQPLISTLSIPGESRSYAYTLFEPRIITLQLIGDTAQPTVSILRDGAAVAEARNTQGALLVTVSAYLTAGNYVVTVGAANNSTGTIALVLQSEQTAIATPLAAGVPASGTLTQQQNLQLFAFSALPERGWLYISSDSETAQVSARVTNSLTNELVTLVGAEFGGARVTVPAGTGSYQLAVTSGVQGAFASPFTVCFAPVSAAASCGETGAPVSAATADTEPVATADVESTPLAACTVTPQLAGGANIRQSASVGSILLGALPGGAVAEVLGISPDGSFYNIRYNAIQSGWVALSVVNASGDCAGLPVVQPPQIIPAPTAVPTATSTSPATATPTATLTPAGPCLITMNAAALVYTEPEAIPDNIYDQVQPGYELIPTGRLADNSFWRTNYAGAWIEYTTMLNTATVTGNCGALPIVLPLASP